MGLSETDVIVLRWIYTAHTNDVDYFKSRHITSDTGIPPQGVTAVLTTLQSHGVIQKWRNSGSPVTWEICI